ncbi:DUF6048 family protein [Fulvivirga sediminis]|uniref:Uncharacterized protein n=1 Tax=Fulvivirga sediminis TaxID=2803949 RepID=A0A937F8P8_9BACT|nr:DUF6048 family protein [Fulvivirga sediminis]MBL3657067.1 hypothetical protein [Fulvivirga sediminis]
MLKYLISASLLLACLISSAQDQKKEENNKQAGKQKTVKAKTDSVINELDSSTMYIPTGVRIGTDVISIIKTFSKDDYKQFNITADIDFHKYLFNIELGHLEQSIDSYNDSASYEVKGSYLKIGPDINFLVKDPDRSALFVGLRYALSSFSDNLSFIDKSPTYGVITDKLENNNLTAHWIELTTGLKVQIAKPLWMGYTARFKVRMSNFEEEELMPNTIPGYGLAEDKVTWGFNYWIMFRIPLRKAPVPNYLKK